MKNRPFPTLHQRAAVPLAILVLVASSLAACSSRGSSVAPTVRAETPAISASPALHRASPALGAGSSASIADVVEGVLPSVVSVTSTKHARARTPMELFFGGPGPGRPQQGLGSGVVLSKAGLIVTNNHVIEGADEVEVQTFDHREFQAKVVGADPKSDVAVLQLQGEVSDLVPARVGDSASLRLGDVVLAVGNPFGVGQTVTMGIVSATGRSNMGIVDYENFIQTDAAINPGNSGGALVNMQGELVGINTAILSRTGGSMGIGFAIPTNMASPIIDALSSDGKVTRGWLGVRIQDIDNDLSVALGLDSTEGVLIADVQDDSPASRGGLASGDVVVAVGSARITSTGHFRNLIASSAANSKIELEVLRAEQKLKLSVKLGTLPSSDKSASDGSQAPEPLKGMDGLTLRELDEAMRKRLDLSSDVQGVVVARVAPGSRAARAGLSAGDVILEINRRAVKSVDQAQERYLDAKKLKLLKVIRHGATRFVAIK